MWGALDAPAAVVRRRARFTAACVATLGTAAVAAHRDLPRSAIAVERDGHWHEWWQSARAPAQWREPSAALLDAVSWRQAAPGVEWGEVRLSGTGEAWRVRVIIARIDPRQVSFALVPDESGAGASWSIARAPQRAVLAANAGQFASGRPWGWLVRDGSEVQPPGTGPLAPAIVVDRQGAVHIVPPDSIARWRAGGEAVTAVQSYPALLTGDGDVPYPLRAAGLGVNVHHRDARLAIGTTRDGRVLLALTRFEGLRGTLSVLPFGFTTPEMAAIMGALGASRAVLLDGGISGQMLIRSADGDVHEWEALRRVPLGLIVTER